MNCSKVCAVVVFPVLVISALALAGCSRTTASSLAPPWARVLSVIDGDTIEVRIGVQRETVRLIGVDTPETKHPTKPVGCYGPEAALHTRQLLPVGAPVRLERDREARDRYGRLLAYVFTTDGLFVNLHLVQGGWATTLPIEPNIAFQTMFADAAHDAQQARRGLWGRCVAS